jgi:hypothetical protein
VLAAAWLTRRLGCGFLRSPRETADPRAGGRESRLGFAAQTPAAVIARPPRPKALLASASASERLAWLLSAHADEPDGRANSHEPSEISHVLLSFLCLSSSGACHPDRKRSPARWSWRPWQPRWGADAGRRRIGARARARPIQQPSWAGTALSDRINVASRERNRSSSLLGRPPSGNAWSPPGPSSVLWSRTRRRSR